MALMPSSVNTASCIGAPPDNSVFMVYVRSVILFTPLGTDYGTGQVVDWWYWVSFLSLVFSR